MWGFEILAILPIKTDTIVLAGKLISGGVLSNEKDVLAKNIVVSFTVDSRSLKAKVIRLDGWFIRPGMDLIAEDGDNLALLLKKDDKIAFLSEIKLSGSIRATLQQEK